MREPSASYLALVQECAHPWTSGIPWPEDRSTAGVLGTRIHRACEALVTGGAVFPWVLAGLSESEQAQLVGCRAMAERYLAEVVRVTIEQEMRKEAGYLRSLRLARERVKQVIEGPDGDIDRIIRSVRDNGGMISNKLIKEIPALADEHLATQVAAAIQAAFLPAGEEDNA